MTTTPDPALVATLRRSLAEHGVDLDAPVPPELQAAALRRHGVPLHALTTEQTVALVADTTTDRDVRASAEHVGAILADDPHGAPAERSEAHTATELLTPTEV